MRALVVVAMLGCGRIGFDVPETPTDDDPPALIDLDLTNCTVPAPLTLGRASPGTYFDASGVLRTALANEPRCAFDGETGEPRGVLVEPGSTNHFGLSRGDGSDVDNLPQDWHSEWGIDVTANAVVTDSPTFLGFREVTITTNNSGSGAQYYQVRIDIEVPSGGDYTLSWWLRSDTPMGDIDLFAGYWTPNFQMSLGSDPATQSEQVPGGRWTRLFRVFQAPATTGIIQAWIGASVPGNRGYTLTLAAPQLEPGRYPTSPILTTNSNPSTRATDRLTTSFPELLGPDAGTIVVDATLAGGPPDVRTVLAVGDAIPIHTVTCATTEWSATRAGSTIKIASPPAGQHRIGHRYDPQASGFAVDSALMHGAAVAPVTGGTASFGTALDGTNALFGSISRIRTWPSSLDDDSLMRATN